MRHIQEFVTMYAYNLNNQVLTHHLQLIKQY